MLFLLNDVVLDLDRLHLAPRHTAEGFRALGVNDVTRMGQELYAERPLLHATHRDRAMRLASLIMAKAPTINAALFVAPDFGCAPHEVSVRYMTIGPHVMAQLLYRQSKGALDLQAADREVWRRLAA
ncbi:hypothetical protein [Phenylobacterium sp.]|uniref:hypothetical protein n=1 Tax=Phenylobacterium sp. TaxID=1871053 RepID=UPI0035B30448